MRHPMRRLLLSTLGVAVLTVAPSAAQQEVPDTRGRVYTLIGGAFGDGPFIAAGAGAGIRLTPHLGLDLELVHLSGVGGPERTDMAYFSTGILEGTIPFFGVGAFDRPRRDVTTFLTKMVVEFPVADGRLFPYLTAGGGVGRVTERFGAGDDLIPWVPVDSISNQPSPEHASGSDPGIVNSDTVYFFDRMTFPRLGDCSALGLALSLGGGVDVRLWRGLGVGVDVRWLRVLVNYDHVDTAQVGLSVSYRF